MLPTVLTQQLAVFRTQFVQQLIQLTYLLWGSWEGLLSSLTNPGGSS
jgi:hypothetical protein